MDLIARFDRGPREEVRVSLVSLGGETFLELRLYYRPGAGHGEPISGPECVRIPVSLYGKLARAIEAMEGALLRRGLLAHEAPEITQMVDGLPTAMASPGPAAGAPGGAGRSQRARSELRLRLDCPVEYRDPSHPDRRRQGRTVDISHTGVQVILPERLPVLSLQQVTLHLPLGIVALPCEVEWTEHRPAHEVDQVGCRHGLRFTQVGPREYQVLDRMLGEAARRAITPP